MAIQLVFETKLFAICDTMIHQPPIHTICLGSAMGMACAAVSWNERLPRQSAQCHIILNQPKNAQGQATDIQIRAQKFCY